MGKVASDKCHKWVFKEPSESEPNLANYWQSSFDAVRFSIFHKSFFVLVRCRNLWSWWLPIYYSFLQNGPTNSNQESRSIIKLLLVIYCSWSYLNSVYIWPDNCCDSSWTWSVTTGFLQDCEFFSLTVSY